jgi:hypothetical protein
MAMPVGWDSLAARSRCWSDSDRLRPLWHYSIQTSGMHTLGGQRTTPVAVAIAPIGIVYSMQFDFCRSMTCVDALKVIRTAPIAVAS